MYVHTLIITLNVTLLIWNNVTGGYGVNRIKEILKELGMTQEELSHISGVPQSEISRIANNKKPRIELATGVKIARGLRRSVEYVFPDY
jgi:transcriptional regulator with XRE-family HTH domain